MLTAGVACEDMGPAVSTGAPGDCESRRRRQRQRSRRSVCTRVGPVAQMRAGGRVHSVFGRTSAVSRHLEKRSVFLDFPGSAVVRNPPAKARDVRDAVQSLGQSDPPEEGMAAHSSVLAWRIPGTEEPGGCGPWGRRLGHDFVTSHTRGGGRGVQQSDEFRSPDVGFVKRPLHLVEAARC